MEIINENKIKSHGLKDVVTYLLTKYLDYIQIYQKLRLMSDYKKTLIYYKYPKMSFLVIASSLIIS